MDPSHSNDPIRDYIKANLGRYTREAIREQLINGGYDPAAIDQALADSRSESPSSQSRVRSTSERLQSGWAIFLYLFGFSVPIWLVAWTLLDESSPVEWPLFTFLFLVFYAVAGLFLVRWVTRSVAAAGLVDLIRFFVFLPVLFAVVLGVGFFATCVAAYRLS